jgi:nitrite reductase (NADH) small subunit
MTPIPVCASDELAEGECRVVTVGDRDVAVFRSEGAVYAIDDRCPHAGASLSSGHVEDGCVTCPWHGWRFRLADGAWADNPRVKTGHYRAVEGEGLVAVHPERMV